MTYKIALVPGDGIGPEVSDATTRAVDATGVKVEWVRLDAGADVIKKYGTALPNETLDAITQCKVGLKGPIGTPIGGGFQSANVQLRKKLDLYASLRPVTSVPGVSTRYEDVDLVVVRENTEGLYAGLEHIVAPGVVESIKVTTERACTRISRFAFEYARREKRKKVTAVHKANIMKLTDGLFLECSRKVAKEYGEIAYEEVIVDNLCMQLVRDPTRYDILLTENLYGDIVSDLCAGLVGGLGVVPGANIGDQTAVFEAVHGTAPDIAGKGIANPTALMRSAVMMLRHLGERSAANRMETAIFKVLGGGKVRTGDLGGKANTREFTDAVCEEIQKQPA
ncbi:MAG: isocitrate/isopropylmalate dehydrogenase family protein [Myxococcota bacterium]